MTVEEVSDMDVDAFLLDNQDDPESLKFKGPMLDGTKVTRARDETVQLNQDSLFGEDILGKDNFDQATIDAKMPD